MTENHQSSSHVYMKTAAELLAQGAEELRRAGVDSPALSARVLLARVLDCSLEKLVICLKDPVEPWHAEHFQQIIVRRSKGEPLAYILGCKEFYGLDFQVDPNVLIPRPETEMLVELIRGRFSPREKKEYADIGTGSGILAICIALYFPLFRCLACDISRQALLMARNNARKHGLLQRILFFASDMGQGIRPASLDFIVCNPPYLSCDDFEAAGREVRDFEPKQALLSRENGLGHIQRLKGVAEASLRKQGLLFLEIGSNQADAVKALFQDWAGLEVYQDLSGRDRVMAAVIP